ncbi:MAG: S8 family serine peptidase [Clostridiaceae bacterium]
MNNNKVTIALIDSGVDIDRKEFIKSNIIPIELIFNGCNSDDTIGHGTAIAFILTKLVKNIIIYSIKLFDKDYSTKLEDLVSALEYIDKNLNVDIVHISSGCTDYNNIGQLQDVCQRLSKKEVIIVSAFDNQGIASYPAVLPDVIGVYWDVMNYRVNEYCFVKNSNINILGYGGYQRLPWKDRTYKSVAGSSFAAPHITAKIANFMLQGIKTYDDIMVSLKEQAKKVIDIKDDTSSRLQVTMQNDIKKMNNAIVFPFNKEIHALIGNSDLVCCNISHVYDIAQFGRIGKRLSDLVYGTNILDLNLESYLDIDWDSDFDTVILGHTDVVRNAFGIDYIEYFLEQCIKYHKNIYSFDNLEKYQNKLIRLEENNNVAIYFHLKEDDICFRTFGSLYKLPNPVIGVIGTSSKQGKFNLQLELRRRFFIDGYYVGQLGTEPSSLLFGMDVMMPTGYNSDVTLSPQKEVYYINNELAKLSDRDIIIVGLQSQTIPYSYGNLGFYTFSQQNLLIASTPDAFILCVNLSDELNYIRRTIDYCSCYFNSHVIALCVFPFRKELEWSVESVNVKEVNNDSLVKYIELLSNEFGIQAFVNGNDANIDDLYNKCIEFFSND